LKLVTNKYLTTRNGASKLPEALPDIDFFLSNPPPIYTMAKDLLLGSHPWRKCHYFFKLLSNKGFLSRMYTQNIDNLEPATKM
jgi:NAD-dependent SIR2 family protein deacetylase